MLTARRTTNSVPRLVLLLSVIVVFISECRFCKSNQTILQQVLPYIHQNSNLSQNQKDKADPSEATLSVCLKNCLDADCMGAVFCYGDCYIIDSYSKFLVQASSIAAKVAAYEKARLSINYLDYCVFYEHSPDISTVSEVPITQSTTTRSSTTTTTNPMRELLYAQEESIKYGKLFWKNWDAGTTLQITIPQDTKGIINFSPISGDGNGELSITIEKDKQPTVGGSGSITVVTSSQTVIRLRKPSVEHSDTGIQVRFDGSLKGTLDENYDGACQIRVNTTNPIEFYWNGQEECGDKYYELNKTGISNQRLNITAYVIQEKKCFTNEQWSVSLTQNDVSSPIVQVYFTLSAYHMAETMSGSLTRISNSRGFQSIKSDTEVAIKFALNDDGKKVSGWINGKLISTTDVNADCNFIYVSGGLTTSALYYERSIS